VKSENNSSLSPARLRNNNKLKKKKKNWQGKLLFWFLIRNRKKN
jgi:hypothetical protein